MKLNITTTSSIGSARALEIKQGGDNKYIAFYSAFGFLNSKFGAKSEYEIELNPLYILLPFFSRSYKAPHPCDPKARIHS